MIEKYTHNCIKCSTQYTSDDVDPYYCKPCVDEKNRIAKEIDAKTSKEPRKKIKTALQEYDEARGGMPFPSINKLGITL